MRCRLIVLQRRRASIRLPRLAVDDFNHTVVTTHAMNKSHAMFIARDRGTQYVKNTQSYQRVENNQAITAAS